MNIFALDRHPILAAMFLCDQHVNKMIVESCQLLATAHPDGSSPYVHTHFNHPCAKWVRESIENYKWLVCYADSLLDEREHRWPHRAQHASAGVVLWYAKNITQATSPVIPMTEFALAMPEAYKSDDAVRSYRAYYATEKRAFSRGLATWTNRPRPDWLTCSAEVSERI